MKTSLIKTLFQLLLCIALLASQRFTQAEIKITYYVPDAAGSPVAATDEQGNIKWRKQYYPFGAEITTESDKTNSSNNHIGYTGHVHDRSTGLTYMGARYYDPVVGRFMGMDPAGVNPNDPRTFNRFAYANNNPYTFIDPDGRNPKRGLLFQKGVTFGPENAGGSGYGGYTGPQGPFQRLFSSGSGRSFAESKGVGSGVKTSDQSSKIIQTSPKNLIPTQTKNEMSGSQIKRLTKDMKKNGFDQSKPVDAVKNPNGRLEIQDGHHRTEAAKKAGIKIIPVRVSGE